MAVPALRHIICQDCLSDSHPWEGLYMCGIPLYGYVSHHHATAKIPGEATCPICMGMLEVSVSCPSGHWLRF